MLLGDRFGERGADAWVRARVRRHLAREGGERIVDAARDVPPSLDGLEREADGLAGRGVSPRASGELVDARFELAVVGGRGQQRTEDLKAQTCPSHPRTRRVVVVGHSPPGRRELDRGDARHPTPTGKTRAAPSSARTASGAGGYITPLTKRDPSGPARGGQRRQPDQQLGDRRGSIIAESFQDRSGQLLRERVRAQDAPTDPRTAGSS